MLHEPSHFQRAKHRLCAIGRPEFPDQRPLFGIVGGLGQLASAYPLRFLMEPIDLMAH